MINSSFPKQHHLPLAPLNDDYTHPFKISNAGHVRNILFEALHLKASDIFIQPGAPITVRIHGKMFAITPNVLDQTEVFNVLSAIINRPSAPGEIMGGKAINHRYTLLDDHNKTESGEEVSYGFRVNASPIMYKSQAVPQIVMRTIPSDPPKYHELGISEDLINRVTPENGIVYIAGRTGSGKTTTFASFIRHILENETPIRGNIITHEEPIEYLYGGIPSKHSIVVQSEIPAHFRTFAEANREAMRRKPGLLVIGELRDQETIEAAIEASMTGHPVYATVHANDVAAVIRRLITRIPDEEKEAVVYDIIEQTECIIAQDLLPTVDGKQVAIREYLSLDRQLREPLYSIKNVGAITSTISSLVKKHGRPFRQDIEKFYKEGVISRETYVRSVRGKDLLPEI